MSARIQNPSNVCSILNFCQCNKNSTLNKQDSRMYTAMTCDKTYKPNTTMLILHLPDSNDNFTIPFRFYFYFYFRQK